MKENQKETNGKRERLQDIDDRGDDLPVTMNFRYQEEIRGLRNVLIMTVAVIILIGYVVFLMGEREKDREHIIELEKEMVHLHQLFQDADIGKKELQKRYDATKRYYEDAFHLYEDVVSLRMNMTTTVSCADEVAAQWSDENDPRIVDYQQRFQAMTEKYLKDVGLNIVS